MTPIELAISRVQQELAKESEPTQGSDGLVAYTRGFCNGLRIALLHCEIIHEQTKGVDIP